MENYAKAVAAVNAAGLEIAAIVIITMATVTLINPPQASVVMAAGATFALVACAANVANFKLAGIGAVDLLVHAILFGIVNTLYLIYVL